MPANMMNAGVGSRPKVTGQQQRDRHRRADAGQDTDEGAEQDADGGVHQVLGRERGLEAAHEQVEAVHQRIPSRMPGLSGMPRPT